MWKGQNGQKGSAVGSEAGSLEKVIGLQSVLGFAGILRNRDLFGSQSKEKKICSMFGTVWMEFEI